MSFKIANRPIGLDQKPFIIAEMSANHEQSLDKALAIVDLAADAGVDAIKIQTLSPEKITLDVDTDDFQIPDADNLWHGQTLFQLYQKAYLPTEWHKDIFDYAKKKGLIAFSTPFDLDAVDFLESLDVPCYKIGSCENRDIPLIEKVAATGKPVIISTGMASAGELDEAVRAARNAGCEHLALLKCTCAYPADPTESNLRTLGHMRSLFECEVGISDHTRGIGAALAGVALGGTIIEKHVRAEEDNGLDAAFSIRPNELKSLVEESATAWASLGGIKYGPTESELRSVRYRRSLYVSKNIKKGEPFDASNVQSVRPGFGLPPKYYSIVLGKKATRDIKLGEPLDWDLVS